MDEGPTIFIITVFILNFVSPVCDQLLQHRLTCYTPRTHRGEADTELYS
jgi:hypothetical protein